MRQLLRLATICSVVLLAACGGPSGPLAPQANTVSPTIAARGETITVTGTRFGTTPGTLSVGGVDAAVIDWTDTTIEATVPEATKNAWQDVTVTTAGGTSSVPDLFVGVEFGGTGPELQSFLDGLDLGTAVLLEAEDYDLTAMPARLIVDNKDIYGRGQDETTLQLPSSPSAVVLARFGEAVTVADLTLVGDSMSFLQGTVSDTVVPAAGSLPRITLERVTFDQTTPVIWGGGFGTPPNVDVTIRDSVLDLEQGLFGMLTNGDLTIERSQVTALAFEAGSFTGGVDLIDSELTGTEGLLAANTGLKIQGSTVETSDGNLQILGAANAQMLGSGLPVGGPIEIIESTVRTLDADFADGTDAGRLMIITAVAPIRLENNPLIRAHDGLVIQTMASASGEGDVELTGNQDIRVGIFESEDPVNYRPADLLISVPSTSLRDRIVLTGNTISSSQQFVLAFDGGDGDVVLQANTISAGDVATGQIVVSVPLEGVVVAEDNHLSTNGVMMVVSNDLAGGALRIAGNTFTHDASTAGILVMGGSAGSCEIADNHVTMDDPSDANTNTVLIGCISDDPAQTVDIVGNEVVATGAAGSVIMLTLSTSDHITVASNSLISDGLTNITMDGGTLDVAGNTFKLDGDGLIIDGDAGSVVAFADNDVEHVGPNDKAFILADVGVATVTNNAFTATGMVGPGSVALAAMVSTNPIALTATGNTFSGYANALYFQDINAGALGIDAAINDNVFDMDIDAAPEVAELNNIGSTIDAENNVWGTNTDLATLQGFVTYSGDTLAQSGDIDLDPITQP